MKQEVMLRKEEQEEILKEGQRKKTQQWILGEEQEGRRR